jgi:hypothetical protein
MGSAPSTQQGSTAAATAVQALEELAAKTSVAPSVLLQTGVGELHTLIEQAGITVEAIEQRAKQLEIEVADTMVGAGTKGAVIVAAILDRAKQEGAAEQKGTEGAQQAEGAQQVERAAPLPKAASAPAALGEGEEQGVEGEQEEEEEEEAGARCHEAGSVVADTARYPMHLMPCDRLHGLTRLPPHEEALASGLLVRVEFAEETPGGTASWEFCRVIPIGAGGQEDGKPLVPSQGFGHGPDGSLYRIDCFHFASHRWDTPSMDPSEAHPDDAENRKLEHMKQIFPNTGREFVWMDFFCVPQADRQRQQDAISSLPFYVKHCGTFNALVRDHSSLVEYLMRVWCEVELLTTLGPIPSRTWLPKLSTQDKYFLVRPSKKFPAGISIKITYEWALNPLAGMVTNPADLEGLRPLVQSQIAQLEDWLVVDVRAQSFRHLRGSF